MAFSYLKIVRVVCRCNFNASGSELFVYVSICDNRDFTVGQRKFQHFSYNISVSFILRIDSYGSIAEQSLRTGRCDFYEAAFFSNYRVVDVPEVACLLLIFNLCIGDGSLAYRAPVDDAASFVDPSFFIQTAEYFFYGFGASLVHGEAFSLPVCGGADLS